MAVHWMYLSVKAGTITRQVSLVTRYMIDVYVALLQLQ